MKAILILTVVLVTAAGAYAADFRCEGNFIEKGVKSFTVQRYCGEPLRKDVIGYKTRDGQREWKIEEWVYGPRHGYYYHVYFEAGAVTRVEAVHE